MSRKRIAYTGLALAAIAGAAVVAGVERGDTGSPLAKARSTAPVAESRIAFARGWPNRDGWGLYVMNADGTGLRRVATNLALAGRGAWSPDGRRIAFEADTDGFKSDISVTNADGSGARNLTHKPEGSLWDGQPAWSPDGAEIAFATKRDDNWDIYVVGLGGDERRLTRSPTSDRAPAWSPDGRLIAFARRSAGIFLINADGSGERRLTQRGWEPAWSPDGRRIAFFSGRDGNQELYVMKADGSGLRNLTPDPAQAFAFAWSPDGRKLAFETRSGGNSEIYVMNADGSGQQNLTRSRRHDGRPAWSPDGRKIAFERLVPLPRPDEGRGFNYELYVMNADGTGQRRLTHNPSMDTAPAWSPWLLRKARALRS